MGIVEALMTESPSWDVGHCSLVANWSASCSQTATTFHLHFNNCRGNPQLLSKLQGRFLPCIWGKDIRVLNFHGHEKSTCSHMIVHKECSQKFCSLQPEVWHWWAPTPTFTSKLTSRLWIVLTPFCLRTFFCFYLPLCIYFSRCWPFCSITVHSQLKTWWTQTRVLIRFAFWWPRSHNYES